MKLTSKLIILLLIVFTLALPFLFIRYEQSLTTQVQTNIPDGFYKTHILGGFSIDTPGRATKAATDGVQVVFNYGQPPSEKDKLGQKLRSLHMKVVDGYIWSLFYYYECHRTKTVKSPPSGQQQYCQSDNYPYLPNENALLASIITHLKQVRDNQLVIGYWVLDDWAHWDAGSARQILIKIHSLIERYTPDRPAICGFGGYIQSDGTSSWSDWIAENFSPQGCDEVGFYIYARLMPDTTRTLSPDSYDWSMSTILPAMFASLQRRGWDVTKEPLIGIGQAYGNTTVQLDNHLVIPTARDIEIQSRSFCEHGAIGLAFYAWYDSGFGPTRQTPMNSPEIDRGIQSSIAACKAYWSKKN